MSDVNVTIRDNGPILVHGDITIKDQAGNEIESIRSRRSILSLRSIGRQTVLRRHPRLLRIRRHLTRCGYLAPAARVWVGVTRLGVGWG